MISATVSDACAGMIEVGRRFDLQVRGRAEVIVAYEVVGRGPGLIGR